MTTKISDLSLDEFRSLLREVVKQTLLEILADPDDGLELREDVARQLRESIEAYQAGAETVSADEVAAQLGLE